ncbi:unnamed protein product [Blepharisma stoltei]|uniref:Enoyl reductase (ER) domain-containing protein n=1 Tax=Blepharisma stoltei TaxID=1481888 RepID=A0AAU9J0B9_9CILI|nr:unnamed protein product [Blepharisma stoltei]
MKAIRILKRRSVPIMDSIPIPSPMSREVLVKMEYSAINPADLATLVGAYDEKSEYPVTLGLEGSGRIESVGQELDARLIGRRIAGYFRIGSWSQFAISNLWHEIPDDLSSEQAAGIMVNPLTAISILNLVGDQGSFIVTAAMSSLGKILIKLGLTQGKRPIGIIRKSSQIEELKQLGLENVLDSSSKDFPKKLKEVSEKEKPSFAIDFIGSTITNSLLKVLQPDGTVIIVGNLSAKPCEKVDLTNLILESKKIKGFHLNDYKDNLGNWESILRQNYSLFVPKIASIKNWTNFQEAITEYRGSLSSGKILLKIE